jgi:hypothetical protein
MHGPQRSAGKIYLLCRHSQNLIINYVRTESSYTLLDSVTFFFFFNLFLFYFFYFFILSYLHKNE